MVGVEFVTRRIAPLQDHRRPIWAHQGDDDICLHASELDADTRGEVIRAFFSTAHILTISRAAPPLYPLGSRDSSRATAGVPRFNTWGPFLAGGVTLSPPPSALVANSEQDSLAREASPEASRDLNDDIDLGEEATRRGRSQSTVVLSDSSDEEDKASMAEQPSGGDATASSSLDLEEEEHRIRLEAERLSKFNAEHASRHPEAEAPHGKGPAGETLAPPPPAFALPGKRGWVDSDAS
jgi:hypothetical protein